MIYIGADHRGFKLKEKIGQYLDNLGYDWEDAGNRKYDQEDDYSDFGIRAAEKTAENEGKGIVVCGSGVGICVAANKVKGIRAGLITSKKQAEAARKDDDINMLCLSADNLSDEENLEIVKVFLETEFLGEEKHVRRVSKISDYEAEKR